MTAPTSAAIRLHLLEDARDAEGQPRAGLLVPPDPAGLSRRPVLVIFASLGAAIEAKRGLEGPR